jgi:hypothetical protein
MPSSPPLPESRGPLSDIVIQTLTGPPGGESVPASSGEPFSEDLALALYVCYELHHHGFAEVSPAWEWDPELLRFRGKLEQTFLSGLRERVRGGADLDTELDELLVERVPGNGVSHYLQEHGEWWHVLEYFVQRSVYHLKEGDPQCWVLPRLRGQAKAAMVAVEFDEYGAGHGDHMHSQLYADLLVGAGLCPDYLHYLDDVPGEPLMLVNLMTMFGLHRTLRGALIGQFASAEITSTPSVTRVATALRRLGADPRCVRFYTEHIEADAVHEQVMRRDVIGDLLTREPELTADVVFGIQAAKVIDGLVADRMLIAWQRRRSSLRTPRHRSQPIW